LLAAWGWQKASVSGQIRRHLHASNLDVAPAYQETVLVFPLPRLSFGHCQ
jgi:hypothetical protein